MRSVIIGIFLFISAHPAVAGAGLSMEDAERLFLENNLEIKSRKIELERSDAALLNAKVLPNPAVRYFLESLQNGDTETEATYSIVQNLDISGKRGKKIEAATRSKEARMLFLERDMSGLLMQMKQTYYKILFLKENERALSQISGFYFDAERKTAVRVSAGDASEADLMKLTGEKNRIIRGLETLRTDRKAEIRKLALMLNMQDADIDVSGEFTINPESFNVQELTERGQQNRPDIKGRGKTVEAAEVLLSVSKKEAIPSIDIEAGYKTRTGGFHGFVFGVSIPLPLFDKNQGGIARAEAEFHQEKLAFKALKNNAAYEVNILSERIASLQARIADLSRQIETAKELTRIAGIAYEEGETGLLELLDAARSEKELVLENNTAVYDYWAARFQLENAVGAKVLLGGTK